MTRRPPVSGLRSSRRHQIGAGALIGLAVLAKPPMFIAAGLLTGWALLLATACDLLALAGGGRPEPLKWRLLRSPEAMLARRQWSRA